MTVEMLSDQRFDRSQVTTYQGKAAEDKVERPLFTFASLPTPRGQ